ncbi:hypothetical protein L6164_026185 [Bauhinia variegata]|uniref:Uncharacterized protein n=1 Tax=Bauhinia variegata TaxID=167791 RepID=A0ACB9LNS9_BAUVA|nr:hypothetical protein L6164_026185 [Bauhinia variegata]
MRTMRDYMRPLVEDCTLGIRRPTITMNNFEMKPSLIHLVQQNQFRGDKTENPYTHISIFTQICYTLQINGASEEPLNSWYSLSF